MRSVFDLFKTRVRNLARARLLASQLVRFCRCDDQSRTINLFQRGHPVHSEKIRYQHGDAQAGRRFHASGDEPINRPFRLRLADNGAHHAAQIFFLMRLIDCEHFELRRHLFWARSDSTHAISDCRVHQHNWSCHNTFRRGETEHKATCGLIGGGYGTEVILYWERRRA